jgi:hypothetical protein
MLSGWLTKFPVGPPGGTQALCRLRSVLWLECLLASKAELC